MFLFYERCMVFNFFVVVLWVLILENSLKRFLCFGLVRVLEGSKFFGWFWIVGWGGGWFMVVY